MLLFDDNESKYESWEVKFSDYLWLQKMLTVILPKQACKEVENYTKINMKALQRVASMTEH